jgi:hypothetical protein
MKQIYQKLIFLLSIQVACNAQAAENASNLRVNICIEQANSELEMTGCYTNEIALLEMELGELYSDLKSHSNTIQVKILEENNLTWQKYYNSDYLLWQTMFDYQLGITDLLIIEINRVKNLRARLDEIMILKSALDIE